MGEVSSCWFTLNGYCDFFWMCIDFLGRKVTNISTPEELWWVRWVWGSKARRSYPWRIILNGLCAVLITLFRRLDYIVPLSALIGNFGSNTT